ncbi:MAG: DUF4173 domain-containing protein [Actinobacteria bacterium]|nr:DUF4173 domain-containing protein [Actinomycetota bacterium]
MEKTDTTADPRALPPPPSWPLPFVDPRVDPAAVGATAWPPSPGVAGPWPPPSDAGGPGGPGGPGGVARDEPPHLPPPDPVVEPDRRALVVLVAIGVAIDLMLRTSVYGVAAVVAVTVIALGLAFSGRLANRWAQGAALAALPFGVFLVLRTSPWLVALDLSVIGSLFVLAAIFASGGALLDVRGLELARRVGNASIGVVLAPSFVFAAVVAALPVFAPGRRERRVAIARGVGLALPALVVLGMLLASSDAVFASLFRVPLEVDSIAANALLLLLGLWVAGTLLRAASAPAPTALAELRKPFGSIEARVVLGGLIVLYGVFAATQVATARGGAEYVITTANLTRAEYARSGFFQLLAVAVLTLVLLVAIKSMARVEDERRARRSFVIMSEVTVVLTLVIVAVAILRINLYDEAYGITMLRLFSLVAAWWLGAVFGLVGLALALIGRGKHWLLGAVLISALVAVLALNALDPESLVVRHNADRFEAKTLADRGADFDVSYAATLSDDAVPALAAALPRLDEQRQRAVVAQLCGRVPRRVGEPPPGLPEPRGGWIWNRSAVEAQLVRQEICT